MKQIIIIFTLSITMLAGCTTHQKEIITNTSMTVEKSPEQKDNNAEILALLDNEEVTISGVYGKFEPGTDNIIRGNDMDHKREFTGKIKDITDLQILEENGKIKVNLIANVEGQFFFTTSPCAIQFIIEKDSDNKLSIGSTTLLEDMLPDITPTIPFDINYVFEPSDTEPDTIRFELSGKEYEANKELYTIEGAEINYDAAINGRDGGGTYYITVPLSKEYIQDLDLDYSKTNHRTAIDYGHIIMTATLKNGLKIYTQPTIRYIPSSRFHTLENTADYWEFTNLNHWYLDKKET